MAVDLASIVDGLLVLTLHAFLLRRIDLVDEALIDGLDGSHPLTVQAKMLRLELLNVKADLERELALFVLDCSNCGQTVHWVAGLSVSVGHWAHREPAPHGEPAV